MNFDLRSRTAVRILQTTAAGLAILALGACGDITAPVHIGAPHKAHAGHKPRRGKPRKHGSKPVPTKNTGPGRGTVPMCTSAGLSVTVAPHDAGAGHKISRLTFTNISGRRCWMRGYPGVSYVTGENGKQLGGSATRASATGQPRVGLAPRKHAYAFIDLADYTNFPAESCNPGVVRGLRVYPPNQTAAKYVPDPETLCQNASLDRPSISPISADPNAR